ncbi:MAG: nucleotide sugar dehydrogenase [Deltaproteobacteria bacterium]|nr:nucleotide sugar dehydrogenase [Deltaproteobacteria bacterium]
MSLVQKIDNRTAKIAVVGLGYVGLPLAARCAGVGLRTLGIDIQQARVDRINRGESDIGDVPSEILAPLVKAGTLTAHTTFEVVAEADAVVICVPTPLSKTRDPDNSYIVKALESVQPYVQKGQLFVLESTTYPGFTREVMVPMLEAAKGYKAGRDIHVAFSPERIDPGNEKFGVKNTTKIVGGLTPACSEAVAALYGSFIDHVKQVTSPDCAEMVKLLENTFRAVNIGLVNEVALMCRKLGLNVFEVIEAAATKPFGFMPFFPGPGLGGHCIPIDPLYLSWKLKSMNYQARFIELADAINTQMPAHVVSRVQDALNDQCKSIKGAKVLVLGVAYKRDIDDFRESPAISVMDLLEKKGALVAYFDPYVPSFREDGHVRTGIADLSQLASYDVAVLTTDHKAFDMADIVARSKLLVDTRNACKLVTGDKSHVYGL